MGFLIKLAGKELKDIEVYLKIAVENIKVNPKPVSRLVDHTSYLRRKFYSLKTGFITIVGCHERTLEKVIYSEV